LRTLRDDWARHGHRWSEPALWALATYRYGRWTDERCPRRLAGMASRLYGGLRVLTEIATGVSLPRELIVGEELHLIHGSNIRVHPKAVIGARVGIMHDVTIGTTLDDDGAPVIGDDVFIGAGAKIVGPVHVGAGARIAANSLVVSDVPPGATAIGVPARAVPPMRHRRAA
jgi:serine O-acetyltransferase